MTSNNLVSTKKPNGRPSAYKATVAGKIVERMISGECLLKICQDHDMPSRSTVYSWIKENIEGFSYKYAYARELMADSYAEEILEIADGDPNNDSPEKIVRDKLRIEARKWYVAKIAPRKYGERQTIAIVGLEAGREAPLAAPIACMRSEHEVAGSELARMRALTNGFSAPSGACNTFRAALAGLAELEADLHQHVHLENNVLFERVLSGAR